MLLNTDEIFNSFEYPEEYTALHFTYTPSSYWGHILSRHFTYWSRRSAPPPALSLKRFSRSLFPDTFDDPSRHLCSQKASPLETSFHTSPVNVTFFIFCFFGRERRCVAAFFLAPAPSMTARYLHLYDHSFYWESPPCLLLQRRKT